MRFDSTHRQYLTDGQEVMVNEGCADHSEYNDHEVPSEKLQELEAHPGHAGARSKNPVLEWLDIVEGVEFYDACMACFPTGEHTDDCAECHNHDVVKAIKQDPMNENKFGKACKAWDQKQLGYARRGKEHEKWDIECAQHRMCRCVVGSPFRGLLIGDCRVAKFRRGSGRWRRRGLECGCSRMAAL